MTETQKLPIFSPPGFHDYSSRRLPPLEIPPDAVPPRSDHQFRSPINQLPSIHSGLPPRHDYHQPSSIHRSAAPVDKLLQHSNPYTPPRSDPPYSPQQYGPSISPRSEFDSRGPRRLTEPRYPYEEHLDFLLLPGSIPQPVYNEQLNLNYELRVRQQPIAARACGFGERDRRVIDPPPIIQLLVTDPKTGIPDDDELRYSLNVVHCTLWNAEGTNEETALIQPDRRTTRRLMGQLVASPSVAKDEHDNEGCFFCFPDLSCRTHGKYRLRFVLMRIDPVNLHVGGFSPILTEVLSDVFTVYTAKDFPGMRPSSALTRALKLQGCNIQVKKGNEKALARKRLTASQEHDNIDDEELKRRRRE
ncbi:hypothetical protein PTRG_09583 [Pyrenophora tritici-repentis Pt-1C-BFP]|uniref:Velvet domain-containing protein n=1 Tax=Pyrenophora tritici-repentis (strain Pt-1C-BFP) TaxID=426418 RepID=B2WHX4_PYRTR|nr:uncharacterized protein PTRG_09583 [Pyrenophora tritici-repentis Pt-1C-BFP]EDU42634.1 hypothetical protein PTRG_09583 [Pyrenophora tritici-repentis Pt-1C-BFP]